MDAFLSFVLRFFLLKYMSFDSGGDFRALKMWEFAILMPVRVASGYGAG